MPVKTLARLVRKAVARGLDPATPAVALANATRPDEAAIAATVASLPARLAELPRGPVIVMIGRVFGEMRNQRREPGGSGAGSQDAVARVR
jgi:uroporphyrin-III C-methyltransferase/precorrin-2 dehydrogenase/sirohydrochlorin ferrochelatase